MATVRFGSYNLLDLFASGSAAEQERYRGVVEVIRALDTDVLAVQEVTAGDAGLAGRRLTTLARDTGLDCTVPDRGPAVALGRHGYHTGLLWRPGLRVVPGSFEAYGSPDFWHSLAMLTFEFDDRRIRHASYHATPFSRRTRAEQADRVLSLLTRPSDRPPVLVGADWNSVGADRLPDGSYYDHDPYTGEWHPDLVYQAEWSYEPDGRRRHSADRVPADLLFAGGLRDVAAALGAGWEPTTGHLDGDPYPDRRIDAIRVTEEVVPALRGVETARTELALASSDHLPVVVSYDPATLAAEQAD